MAAPNPTQLLKDATNYSAKGKHEKALECYQKLIQLNPKDTKIWVKTGDTLRKMGINDQAVSFYTKAAAQYALHGFLLQAISVNKLILEIDPNHKETQEALAELYAKREGSKPPPITVGSRAAKAPAATTPKASPKTPRLANSDDARREAEAPAASPAAEPAAGTPVGAIKLQKLQKPRVEIVEKVREKPAMAAAEETLISEVLEADFAEASSENASMDQLVDALPQFPLFSNIDPATFADFISEMELHRFSADDLILQEGDIGTAFYIISEGKAGIWKKGQDGAAMQVGVLGPGDFFGEFGSLTGTPRAVSIMAEEDMLVLEIGQVALNALMQKHAELAKALEDFYRQRLVGTILQTSPLFAPLDTAEREQILQFFKHNIYEPQDEIIRQGEPGKHLVVIISGQVAVSVKDRDGNENMVAILREGEFLGEISLLTGKTTTATCTAINRSHVYEMPGEVFRELLSRYPTIMETVKKTAKSRVEDLRGGYMGQDEFYKAGLV